MALTKIRIFSLLSFIAFALFMFLFFRNYILDKHNAVVKVNIGDTKQFIYKSISYLINQKKHHYLDSSNIIFSDDQILEALKSKDRESFYKYVKNYYGRMKKRDVDFWGLHIILPDNMSFIRVHKPHVADKLIPKGEKTLIDQVNETRQPVTSFDAGKFGYFLRIVTPIFSKEKKYLGVAEFSVSVDSFTQYIKNEFEFEALFLVKNKKNKKFLNDLPKTKHGLTIFKSTDENYFTNYILDPPEENHSSESFFTGSKNKIFGTTSIKLSDSADLVVAFDVTKIINEGKTYQGNITALISFVIAVFSIIWFFATKLYIKDKKFVAAKLKRSHDIISENIIFCDLDLNGIITFASNAFCRVSGYGRDQIVGILNDILGYRDVKDSTYKNLWKTIKADNIWKGEVKNTKQNGDDYWVDVTISPRFDKDRKIGYMAIKQDVTDKKIIEDISITDSLCEIYNRRYFDNVFPKIIRVGKRKNELICFLIMDIDYFKQYNDTYGHQRGDDVLKNVAKTLNASFQRADDYCFRLGGEEFGAIFKADDKLKVFNFANRIRFNIENLKISHTGNKVNNYVTASFGVVCQSARAITNVDKIYKDADVLLYKAKDSGRNKVMVNV